MKHRDLIKKLEDGGSFLRDMAEIMIFTDREMR